MFTRRQIDYWQFIAPCRCLLLLLWLTSFNLPSPVNARVAGKIGYNSNYYSGKSYSGINDEIIYVSIGMGVTIIVLISLALCYIAHEKCKKKREFYITA